MNTLIGAFNEETVPAMMCRTQLSVSWDGTLYDCDFNQAVGMPCKNDLTIATWQQTRRFPLRAKSLRESLLCLLRRIGVELRRLNGVGLAPLNRRKPSAGLQKCKPPRAFSYEMSATVDFYSFKSIISRWHNERSLPYEEAHCLHMPRSHAWSCASGRAKPTAKGIERGRFRELKAALTPFTQIDPLSRGSHSELRQRYFSSYCGISVSSTSSKLPS